MRILYLADIRFPLERANGIQTFRTCLALARRGHAVTLLVRPDTARPARDPFAFYGAAPDAHLSIVRAAVRGPATARRVSYVVQAIGRAIRRRDFHIVFTRDLSLAAELVRLPRAVRLPVVYEAHGFAPLVSGAMGELVTGAKSASPAKRARLERRERRVWERADGYVTITRALAQELTSRFGSRDRLAVVPDGVDLNTCGVRGAGCEVRTAECAPRTEPGRRPVVAYAGHLYPWKGVDVLLDALAEMPDVGGLVVGGLAGEPDLGRLRRRADDLGIAGRVEFTGAVAPPEVSLLLARADVVVLPNTSTDISSRYTSPLKLFEYMASGRPIVCSDLPALGEVLEDGVNALLVPPGDAARLAAAIRRLLDDRELAGRLATTARTQARSYTWEQRAERLERVLAEARRAEASRPARPEGQVT